MVESLRTGLCHIESERENAKKKLAATVLYLAINLVSRKKKVIRCPRKTEKQITYKLHITQTQTIGAKQKCIH